MRKEIKNCPACDSTKIDAGEYYYKYGNDRRLICHSCGFEVDNATEEELKRDAEIMEEYWAKWNIEAKEKRRKLYLKLKAEFHD